jgi:4'-phosphopantetheinyl transferase EntD
MRVGAPAAKDLVRALALLGLSGHRAVRDTQLLMQPFGEGRVLPVCLIEFDAAAFTPNMFATFGVERPSRLAASVHKRQAEFFFGRMAARAAMLVQGLPAREVAIGPYRQPLWPRGLTGSISHAATWAVATVTVDAGVRGVGIDIEAIVRKPDADEALRATVFNAQELEYLAALPSAHDLETRLTLGFSAKEAFFKAAFEAVGRYFDFAAVQVGGVDEEAGTLVLTLQESLCDALRPGRRCSISWRPFQERMVLTGFAW